jgi:hypothetical protein
VSEPEESTIWRINLDGTGLTQLTSGGVDWSPAWLPEPP